MIVAIPGETPEQVAARKKKLFQQTKAVGITFPSIDPEQMKRLLAAIARLKLNEERKRNGLAEEEEVEVIPEPDFELVVFHPNNTIMFTFN
jgi:hypothetical protein